jgi:hypothetical protein
MYLTKLKILKLLLPISNKYEFYLDGGGPRYQFHIGFYNRDFHGKSEINKAFDFVQDVNNLFNGQNLPILKMEIKNVPGPRGGMISIRLPRPSKIKK